MVEVWDDTRHIRLACLPVSVLEALIRTHLEMAETQHRLEAILERPDLLEDPPTLPPPPLPPPASPDGTPRLRGLQGRRLRRPRTS